jgi:hypothetical protein
VVIGLSAVPTNDRRVAVRRWLGAIPKTWGLTLALGLVAAVTLPAVLFFHSPSESPVDFNRDIRPIFNRSCIGCHGGVRQAGGFSVQFREEALQAGESGRLPIVPGSPAKSELIRRVMLPDQHSEHMPKRGVTLSATEQSLLQRWIEEGAVWQDYWAYVPPAVPKVPAPRRADWARNPVDAFVLSRLERNGREPSPRADCARLLRRASLDLTGLPSTFEQTQRFCADPSQENYLREVDRLLASPQFGERWASLWLDLARYSDSIGYEDNSERTIWEYRDWVIRAFNRDLPFDRFTIEQLAGDLLPNPSVDQLIATAYHRNTPSRNDEEEFRIEAVMDRVGNTWEVWQGQTMSCARCHSHTYDPFRQTDFYKLMAFFNNTEDADNKGNQQVPGVPKRRALEWPVHYRFAEKDAGRGERLVAERDALRLGLLAARERPDVVASREQWEAAHQKFRKENPGFDTATYLSDRTGFDFREIDKIIVTDLAERTPNDRSRVADFYALEVAPELAAERKRWKTLTSEILLLKPVQTPVMLERPEFARRPTHLLVRGAWRRPDVNQPMTPDVPGSMPPLPPGAKHDRLALAQWLVNERNPLTARVTVNRFWAELWGRGIVGSVGNFGTQGELPTDPLLLDWLAVSFQTDMKWSVKTLLRTLVASATYQQTSVASTDAYTQDPRNEWLARGPRGRLSAEAVRDQALAVAGLLNLKQFGPPVVAPSPPDKEATDRASPVTDPYRRSVYQRVERKNINPTFETFDHSSRTIAASERGRTNTPLQALVVLNEPEFVAAADALASKMERASAEPEEQVRWLFRTVLAREPSVPEFEALSGYYRISDARAPGFVSTSLKEERPDSSRARRLIANVILNLDAVLTKE